MPVVDQVTFAVDQPEGVLRRRRGLRAQEHHLGGGPRPRRGDLHPQALPGPGRHRPPAAGVTLVSQKMGIHEWSYDNDISNDLRYRVPLRDKAEALGNVKLEVELGFDRGARLPRGPALPQLRRPDGVRRAPCASSATPASTSARWTASPSPRRRRGGPARTRLNAPALNLTQDLYVSGPLNTGRVMVKDEDVCLHCGLCAERCPTGAWDMQKFLLDMTHAGGGMSDGDASTARWRPLRPARRQRLRRQVRQRQRLGLGQRQRPVRQVDPAHGRAGGAAQHLPVQHPGPADLVRGAGHRGGPSGPARRRRPDGGDEPADLGPRTSPRSSPAATCSTTPPSRCRRRSSATTSPSSACR